MKMMTGLIIFLCMVAALILLCAVAILLKRKFPSESYDERQLIARGDAYRFSFWIGFLFDVVAVMLLINQVGKSEPFVEGYLLLFAGLLVKAMAFHIYCLFTHAALPLSGKPVVTAVCYLVMSGMYLLQFLQKGEFGWIPLSGQESAAWLQLIMAISFGFLALAHIVNMLRREKEQE